MIMIKRFKKAKAIVIVNIVAEAVIIMHHKNQVKAAVL